MGSDREANAERALQPVRPRRLKESELSETIRGAAVYQEDLEEIVPMLEEFAGSLDPSQTWGEPKVLIETSTHELSRVVDLREEDLKPPRSWSSVLVLRVGSLVSAKLRVSFYGGRVDV